VKIAVITQEDSFVIPLNIETIIRHSGAEVSLAAILDVSGSLVNRKSVFLRGFGLLQACRMGRRLMWTKAFDLLDRLFGYRLPFKKRSVRAVAQSNGIPFLRIHDPNGPEFLERLRKLQIDLVLSLSAPCKFNEELLTLPRYGCINLHCSLLPRYAGLLPSFWVLFHGEQATGATVHYMAGHIDDGGILGQVRIPIEPGMSMFDVIQKTKAAGGDLILTTIRDIQSGNAKAAANDASARTYFSWPTVEQMRAFRKRGGRLI
jgi:methionyl-tRNA formyltransferase